MNNKVKHHYNNRKYTFVKHCCQFCIASQTIMKKMKMYSYSTDDYANIILVHGFYNTCGTSTSIVKKITKKGIFDNT